MPSSAGWSAGWWRSSWTSVWARWKKEPFGTQSRPGHRPATARAPRRAGCASGASSSDDRSERTNRTTETLRNDEHEDLHGPRWRDGAQLVRRRCGGPDARTARVPDRPRARGQAQADVDPESRFG